MSEPSKNTIQILIVQQLAQFNTPQEIVNIVKETFNQEISCQLVTSYDPTKPNYSAGKKWKALFHKERENFLADVKAIPIANASYRLQQAQNEIDRLKSNPNPMNTKLLLQLLEFGAKETGGMFTNKREVTITPMPIDIARGLCRKLINQLNFSAEEVLAFVTGCHEAFKDEVLNSEFLDFGKDFGNKG